MANTLPNIEKIRSNNEPNEMIMNAKYNQPIGVKNSIQDTINKTNNIIRQ